MNHAIIGRPRYLSRVEPWIGTPLIKVVTGQRRVGKSSLLLSLRDRFEADGTVLFLDKERSEWASVTDARALQAWIDERMPSGRATLMIDEVQEIAEFHVALRSLLAEGRLDIYVTGSNAELLSGEIATRFAGRSVAIEVHPLSYDEFLTFHGLDDGEAALQRYMRHGGLPFLRNLPPDDHVVFEYLGGVVQTALLKDVVSRHSVRSPDLLERLVLFLADNVGSPVSATSIARFLKSQRTQASVPTILNYLGYLTQAYIVRRLRRADLIGKRFLEVAEKYYFEDLGLRAAVLGVRSQDIGKLVENAVLGRLLVDGWAVSTGEVGSGFEVDFVCTRGDERMYIQATYLMAEQATRDREFRALLAIPDNHPKAVVSMDPIRRGERGIAHLGLRDFLRAGWDG